MKAVLSSEYLPPISSFWVYNNYEDINIDSFENYQKKSTRNRAKIIGVNGIQVLSVPLKKGKNGNVITAVEIAYNDPWVAAHLHSIRSAYGKSPYFDFYYDVIADVLNSNHKYLFLLNKQLLDLFFKLLDLEVDVKSPTEYKSDYGKAVLDLRSQKFGNRDISDYNEKTYNQVFDDRHSFVGGLSILDLLMCKGPESILYL
ncbi:MAG: WbqC family protein [Saprospiraceae bacterium]